MKPTKISGGDTADLNNQSPNVFSWLTDTASNVGTGITGIASNIAGVFSSKPIEIGTKIFGKYKNGIWYPAVIKGMNQDGTYKISYNDFGTMDTVSITDIRLVHPGITIDKEKYFNKLYNYALEVDNQKKLSGLGVANKPTETNCRDAARIASVEIKSCNDYNKQMNDPEFQQYFKREKIYNIYTTGLKADVLNTKLYGGKSCKHRKSHKHNKSRKNRKSRKQRK